MSGARASSSAPRRRQSRSSELLAKRTGSPSCWSHRRLDPARPREHDIDPRTLSYKTGDAFQAAASRPQHTARGIHRQLPPAAPTACRRTALPSARGQGEPLSGRPRSTRWRQRFAGVLLGEPEDLWLIVTDRGVRLQRAAQGAALAQIAAGKAVLQALRRRAGVAASGRSRSPPRKARLPPRARPGLPPDAAARRRGWWTSDGRLLLFGRQ